MMNINVKSPNLHIKYLPNTKKIDPTLNSKFVCTVVYCSEFKVIFSGKFCSRFVTSTTETLRIAQYLTYYSKITKLKVNIILLLMGV